MRNKTDWNGNGILSSTVASIRQRVERVTKKQWWIVAAVVAGFSAIWITMGTVDEAAVGGMFLWAVIIIVYFAPSAIAISNKHASTGGIIVLNIFGGLLFGLGWIIALVWSLSDPSPKSRTVSQPSKWRASLSPESVTAAPPVQYQVGDIVNGHRFNGVDWVKVY